MEATGYEWSVLVGRRKYDIEFWSTATEEEVKEVLSKGVVKHSNVYNDVMSSLKSAGYEVWRNEREVHSSINNIKVEYGNTGFVRK